MRTHQEETAAPVAAYVEGRLPGAERARFEERLFWEPELARRALRAQRQYLPSPGVLVA
jgi:anti-sigma factor RsiW